MGAIGSGEGDCPRGGVPSIIDVYEAVRDSSRPVSSEFSDLGKRRTAVHTSEVKHVRANQAGQVEKGGVLQICQSRSRSRGVEASDLQLVVVDQNETEGGGSAAVSKLHRATPISADCVSPHEGNRIRGRAGGCVDVFKTAVQAAVAVCGTTAGSEKRARRIPS